MENRNAISVGNPSGQLVPILFTVLCLVSSKSGQTAACNH